MTFILGCQHVKNIRKVDFVEKSFASSSIDIDIYIHTIPCGGRLHSTYQNLEVRYPRVFPSSK